MHGLRQGDLVPRRRRLIAFVILLTLLGGSARRSAAGPDTALALARSSLASGRSLDYARELTAMGPRLTGSMTYQRAVDWAEAQFRAIGATQVTREPFTIERGWERVSARARLLSPADRPVHVESLGWMPSTPEGGVEGEVVALMSFFPEASNPSPRGKIVLLPDGDPPGSPATGTRTRRALAITLRDAGALAMVSADSDPANELTARGYEFTTTIGVLPAAQIGRDDARTIRDLLSAAQSGCRSS